MRCGHVVAWRIFKDTRCPGMCVVNDGYSAFLVMAWRGDGLPSAGEADSLPRVSVEGLLPGWRCTDSFTAQEGMPSERLALALVDRWFMLYLKRLGLLLHDATCGQCKFWPGREAPHGEARCAILARSEMLASDPGCPWGQLAEVQP